MIINRRLLFFGVFALWLGLIPWAAWAEDAEWTEADGLEGFVTVGAAGVGVDNESSKFREYSGIGVTDGYSEGYFVGDMELRYKRNDYYMDLFGDDIGLENRNVYLQTGVPGKYKFFAELQELPHQLNNFNQSLFQNPGSSGLVLPAGLSQQSNSTSAFNLTGSRELELEIDGRKAGTFGLSFASGMNALSLSYRRETKDGLKSMGGPTGTAGGGGNGARTVVLPEPVDQVDNVVRASLAHNGRDRQVKLDFYLSLFDNQIESLSWQEIFARSTTGAGLTSREPDNKHWKLSLSGGQNIGETSRVSGMVEYGVMSQNQKLLPFALATSASLLPRSNAEAEIQTLHVNMNVSSRPFRKLGLKAGYRHYETFNETEQSLFRYIRNDSETTQAGIAADEAMFNQPEDYRNDQVRVGASYALPVATTATLDYVYDRYDRPFREVKITEENSIKLKLRNRHFSWVQGGYTLQYSLREEDSTYDGARVFRQRHTDQFIAAGTTFDNVLDLKQYDIAERVRLKHGLNLGFYPSDKTSIGLSYSYLDDDFEDSPLGTQFFRTHDTTLDLGHTLNRSTTFQIFYNFRFWESDQIGREHTSTTFTDITRNWTAKFRDFSHTVGMSGVVRLMHDRLTLNADYSFTQSIEKISFETGTNAAVAGAVSLPDLETIEHTVNVQGTYRLRKNLDLGMRYLFESYQSADFSTDNFSPNSSAIDAALTLSGTVPDVAGHTLMLFATYRIGSSDSK